MHEAAAKQKKNKKEAKLPSCFPKFSDTCTSCLVWLLRPAILHCPSPVQPNPTACCNQLVLVLFLTVPSRFYYTLTLVCEIRANPFFPPLICFLFFFFGVFVGSSAPSPRSDGIELQHQQRARIFLALLPSLYPASATCGAKLLHRSKLCAPRKASPRSVGKYDKLTCNN